MGINIISGVSDTVLSVDPNSHAARVTLYDANGSPACGTATLSNVLNALNSNVTIVLGGQSTMGLAVAATLGTMTLVFEYTMDNVSWSALSMIPVGGGASVSSSSGNGQWIVSTGGMYAIRVRVASITGAASMTVSVVLSPGVAQNISQSVSGNVVAEVTVSGSTGIMVAAPPNAPVWISGSVGINGITFPETINVSGAVAVSNLPVTQSVAGIVVSAQGSPGMLAGAWPHEITDGVHGPVAVKAASIAAVTSDPALVIALSPNSPLPAGGNVIGGVTVSGTSAVSGTVISNQGTAAPLSAPWPVEVTDGVSVLGTSSHPLKVDPTGTTPQPVSGTLTVVQTASANLQGSVGGLAAAGAAPVGNPVLIAGFDGAGVRTIATDASGRQLIVGAGSAGTPSGGVLSVQGVSGGQSILVIASQGVPNTIANSWPHEITDGTHGPVAVKAASVAATSTDPSLVVGLSPNSSLPAGSNALGTVSITGTTAISAVSLPLPVGAATSANLTNGSQQTQIVSGSNVVTVTLANALKVDSSAVTQPVSAVSLPLPVGAATSANQTTLGVQTTELNDGVHTATIKAASTSSAVGDTALVVALSPNTPVPAGANVIGSVVATQMTASNLNVTTVQGTPAAVTNAWPVEVTDGTNVLGTSSHPIRTDPVGTTTQPVSISSTVSITGTTVTNQGIANTLVNAWPHEITDGVHGPVAVKAPSVAAIASDPALVVVVSPNNSVAISATALPLPTNAATSINQTNGSQQTQIVSGSNTAIVTTANALKVDGSAVTQPISATALPLPAGAATSANLTTLGVQTTQINDGVRTATVKASNTATVVTDTALVVGLSPNSPLPTGSNVIGVVSVAGTTVVSAATLPLPSGAATSANQTNGNHQTQIVSGSNTAFVTSANALKVDGSAVTQPVSTVSLPLPAGAATSANQTTLGSQTTGLNDGVHTATIKAAAVASVTGDTALVIALSPNTPVPAGTNVIGSVIATQSTATNLNVTAVQGASTTPANAWPVEVTDGTNILGTASHALRVDPVGTTTQPVSISSTVTVTGTATANQGTANTLVNAWPSELTDGTHGPVAVKAAGVAAVTADPALVIAISPNNSVAVTANALPLPAGAATSANQINGNQQTQIVGGGNSGGGTGSGYVATVTSANALKVDSSAVTQPVSVAALPLPAGAASAANQTTLGSQTTEINDGTRTATIKASSIAANATDTSLVTALSPNSSLPAGTNVLGALVANQSVNLTQVAGASLLTGGTSGSFGVGGLAASGAVVSGNPVLMGGSDGTNVHAFLTDTLGRPVIVGAGTAGTPTGGIVTIQGIANATAVPCSVSSLPLPTNAATSANQTTLGAQTTELNDGVHTATIKAASTTPNATDTALVTVISPNQTAIPVTVSSGVVTTSSQTSNVAVGYVSTSATAQVAINATTYTEQSINFTGSIKSSSASDASAGTGARTVTIYYVDQTGVTAGSETIALNGITAVNLSVTTKCYVERMVVATVGSGGVNAGTITLYSAANGGGAVVGTIAVGDNRTFWAHHYVVTGKTCYLTSMHGLNNTSAGTTFMVAMYNQILDTPITQASGWILGSQTSQGCATYYNSIAVAVGPARVLMYGTPSTTGAMKNYGSFTFYDA